MAQALILIIFALVTLFPNLHDQEKQPGQKPSADLKGNAKPIEMDLAEGEKVEVGTDIPKGKMVGAVHEGCFFFQYSWFFDEKFLSSNEYDRMCFLNTPLSMMNQPLPRNLGPLIELESQQVLIGPLPLGKFFQTNTLTTLPGDFSNWADLGATQKLNAELASLEVYLIDKKFRLSSSEWQFRSGAEDFPKIVVVEPKTGSILTELKLKINSPQPILPFACFVVQNATVPFTERQVQIEATVWKRFINRGFSGFQYGGIVGNDFRQFAPDLPRTYRSDILNYGLDGKLRNNPNKSLYNPLQMTPEDRNLNPNECKFNPENVWYSPY